MTDLETTLAERLHQRAERVVAVPDLDGLHRRPVPRRDGGRRTPFALAVLGVAAALVVAVTLGSRLRGSGETTVEPADQVSPGPDPGFIGDRLPAVEGPELVLFLEPDIGAEELGRIRISLDENPLVEGYSYVDEDATYREFVEYYAGQPEVVDMVRASDLPTSFRITTDDTAAVAWLLGNLAGVSDIGAGGQLGDDEPMEVDDTGPPVSWLDDRTFIVWMGADVTDAEREAVAELLAGSDAVAAFTALDGSATWRELRSDYAGHENLLDLVDRDRLSGSFRVVTDGDPVVVAEAAADLAGVRAVTLGRTAAGAMVE